MPFSTMAEIVYLESQYDSGAVCDEDKKQCADLEGFKGLNCNEDYIIKPLSPFNLSYLVNVESKLLLAPKIVEYDLVFDERPLELKTNFICVEGFCINRKSLIRDNGYNSRQCKLMATENVLKPFFETISRAKLENKL